MTRMVGKSASWDNSGATDNIPAAIMKIKRFLPRAPPPNDRGPSSAQPQNPIRPRVENTSQATWDKLIETDAIGSLICFPNASSPKLLIPAYKTSNISGAKKIVPICCKCQHEKAARSTCMREIHVFSLSAPQAATLAVPPNAVACHRWRNSCGYPLYSFSVKSSLHRG